MSLFWCEQKKFLTSLLTVGSPPSFTHSSFTPHQHNFSPAHEELTYWLISSQEVSFFFSSRLVIMDSTILFILSSLLTLSLPSQVEPAKVNPQISVIGIVYCDICSNNTFSRHSYFLPGSKIKIPTTSFSSFIGYFVYFTVILVVNRTSWFFIYSIV